MADANTGSAGLLRVVASETAPDAATNKSTVSYAFYLIERATANSTFGNGKSASVDWSGVATLWSGTFSFDWRAAGLQTTLIASGSFEVTHNPDGSGSVTITGNMGATGTSGAGGPTSVSQGLTLTKLTSLPGTPSSVVAVRNSDTQIGLSWAQSSATNGQPTANAIRVSVNDAALTDLVSIAPASATVVAAASNQKLAYSIKASNAAGSSGWSALSAPVFTTPAAPTDVAAAKDDSLDIVVTLTPHVAYSEHQHVVVHGTIAAGVTTWDGSPLTALAAGVSTYTHESPDASKVHVYKVYARSTDTAALTSAEVVSNSVQLLIAPNKPTLPTLAPYADKAKAFVSAWVHNPVDTTPQAAYEVGYSTDAGSTWSTTGKVASAVSSKTFAANTYAAGQKLTWRVRTWGQATTGGSDGTGASPWSDQATVTFKTRPVVTIVAPTDEAVVGQATLNVQLGFSQVEGAAFVAATLQLYSGATLVEQLDSTTLASTVMATRVANGGTYTVKVSARDSNGLVSDLATADFTVEYTEPVAAVVVVTYLEDSGIGQIGLDIPEPGAGEVEAVAVSISRTIDGEVESVVAQYPAAAELAILDMTPTIHGDNLYRVTTFSADGATTVVEETLTTSEEDWAFMSTGPGFTQIIRFGGELKPHITPTVDSALVKTSGRSRPIGLYGRTGGLVVSGTGDVVTGLGSSAEEIEAFLLVPGKCCYRDPTGRRMFGMVTGEISRDLFMLGTFSYTVTETS